MKQNLAISYAMKRKAKKMAYGGDTSSQKPKNYMDPYNQDGISFTDNRGLPPEKYGTDPNTIVIKKNPTYGLGDIIHSTSYAEGGRVPKMDVGYPSKMIDEFGVPIASQDRSGYPSQMMDKPPNQSEDDPFIMNLMKKRARGYSKGGMVSNSDKPTADFEPNEFDDLHLNDDLESDSDGANNGDMLGNKREDMDREDIISRIMKSRAKKDRMPSPA